MIHPPSDDILFEDTKNLSPVLHDHGERFHHRPHTFGDKVAYTLVHFSALCADIIFQKKYGHRAVVLETIAAVPGMVGGLLQHLKALRLIRDDRGWIKALIDEAENERMHLMVYSHIVRPSLFERFCIIVIQFFFYHAYLIVYLISGATAHRAVGYLEEEAVHSYHEYLRLVDQGVIQNVHAPSLAKKYWHLDEAATLRDVILATIKDEMIHRDVNHLFADDKQVGFWN